MSRAGYKTSLHASKNTGREYNILNNLPLKQDLGIKKQWFENNDLDHYFQSTSHSNVTNRQENQSFEKDDQLKSGSSNTEDEEKTKNIEAKRDLEENTSIASKRQTPTNEMSNSFYNNYFDENASNNANQKGVNSQKNYRSTSNITSPCAPYSDAATDRNGVATGGDRRERHEAFDENSYGKSAHDDYDLRRGGDDHDEMRQGGGEDRPEWLREAMEEEERLSPAQQGGSKARVTFDDSNNYIEKSNISNGHHHSNVANDDAYDASNIGTINNSYNENNHNDIPSYDNYHNNNNNMINNYNKTNINTNNNSNNVLTSNQAYSSYNHKNRSSIFDPDDGMSNKNNNKLHNNNNNNNRQNDYEMDNRFKVFKEPPPSMSMLMNHGYSGRQTSQPTHPLKNQPNQSFNQSSINSPTQSQLPFPSMEKKYVPTWVESNAAKTASTSSLDHNQTNLTAAANKNNDSGYKSNSFYSNYNDNNNSSSSNSNNNNYNSNNSNYNSNNSSADASSRTLYTRKKSLDFEKPDFFSIGSTVKSPSSAGQQDTFWDKLGSSTRSDDFRKKKVDINSSILPHTMRPPMRK